MANNPEVVVVPSFELDDRIEALQAEGFRLDMITPADAPRMAEMSRGDEQIRVVAEGTPEPEVESEGRAGMIYRDLVPDRLGGRVIASHITVPTPGPVPDYVHHHDVEFQIIFVRAGRVKVVYEDQGEPFWMQPGDCVLQPPGIRHRVLETEGRLEVIEVTSPAEHPTYVEHDLTLPTPEHHPDRNFGGQRFCFDQPDNRIVGDSPQSSGSGRGWSVRGTQIRAASNGAGGVRVLTAENPSSSLAGVPGAGDCLFVCLVGDVTIATGDVANRLEVGAAVTVEPGQSWALSDPTEGSVVLEVEISH